ncbi:MAG TPA: S8 family serine peptidase, partial [Polyangiaceae bacterium]|nr:S8 family serine peptidase [Polyangiaceae bacterium]
RRVVRPFACDESAHDPSKPTVVVVDTGFDVSHPALRPKVAGCYHIECAPEPEAPGGAPPGSLDEWAAREVAELGRRDESCQLVPGLELVVEDYLLGFDEDARAEWNAALFEKRPLNGSFDVDTMFGLLSAGTDGTFSYHGTQTAGLIAYENDVNLVLVQRELLSPGRAAEQIECITQQELDDEVALYARPDVEAAFLAAPLPAADEAMIDLRRRFGARVENRSFGALARSELEYQLAIQGCADVDLGPWFARMASLDERRELARRASGAYAGDEALVVQSSGNEGALVDGAADSLECVRDGAKVLVGSYGLYRGRGFVDAFSNYGACVDLYAMGSSVIAPSPNGFFTVVTGTSFSAPLAARAASALAPSAPTAAALR